MADAVLEVPVGLRPARRDDLRARNWLGLHACEREVIDEAFAGPERGAGAMLLAKTGGFPVAPAWIDFRARGSRARPVIRAVRISRPLQRREPGAVLMESAEALVLRRGARQAEIGVARQSTEARRVRRGRDGRPVGDRTDMPRHGFEGEPFVSRPRQDMLRRSLPCPFARLECRPAAGERRR